MNANRLSDFITRKTCKVAQAAVTDMNLAAGFAIPLPKNVGPDGKEFIDRELRVKGWTFEWVKFCGTEYFILFPNGYA